MIGPKDRQIWISQARFLCRYKEMANSCEYQEEGYANSSVTFICDAQSQPPNHYHRRSMQKLTTGGLILSLFIVATFSYLGPPVVTRWRQQPFIYPILFSHSLRSTLISQIITDITSIHQLGTSNTTYRLEMVGRD